MLKGLSIPKKLLYFAIVIYSAICWAHLVSSDSSNIANSITGLILIITSGVVVSVLFKHPKNRIYAVSIVIGFFLSASIVLGKNIADSGAVRDISSFGDAGLGSLTTYFVIFGLVPVCAGFILSFYNFLNHKIIDSQKNERIRDDLESEVCSVCGKKFSNFNILVLSSIVIFVCWVPVLLTMFPGVNGYDSSYQIKQFFSGNLNSHHPVLHTLFLGFCVSAGQYFSSNELGILIYSIVQMLIMSWIFGLACRCIFVVTHSKVLLLCSLVWFALCPLNSVFSISATKDVLFCGFVVLSICLFTMIFIERNKHQLMLIIGLILSLSLMLLFRNNAVIAYVFVLVGLLIFAIKRRTVNIKWCVVAVCPALFFFVVVGPISATCGVTNSSSMQESLSVPIQQLARTAILSDDLSDSEMQTINELIPNWKQYQAGISDKVKNSFNSDYFQSNTSSVISDYFSIGFSHLKTYTDSFLVNTYGYWYPDASAMNRGDFAYHPYFETSQNMEELGESYFHANHQNKMSIVGSLIQKIDNSYLWEKIPGVALLLNSGAIIWFYIIALGFSIATKKSSHYLFIVIPIIFLIFYWFTCVLGPCLLVRYIYPLFAALPFVISFIGYSFLSGQLKNTVQRESIE